MIHVKTLHKNSSYEKKYNDGKNELVKKNSFYLT